MGTVTVHYAKTNLSRLIERALAGEEIIIARGKIPVLRLIPVDRRPPRRKFGSMRGRLRVPDSFFLPLSEKELQLWYGRR
jgi:antitoxin (DNA-binding transcriptional repressor) of toxin-antitoxin stability system